MVSGMMYRVAVDYGVVREVVGFLSRRRNL